MLSCSDENALVAYVAGHLSVSERNGIQRHLAGCDDCRALLIALVRDATGSARGARRAAPDDGCAGFEARHLEFGRFEIVDVVGSGGMGTVYAARDPELRRKVALKVLHGEAVGARALEQLRSEARALARLSHPNIVAVYDVGTDSGSLYIAMELVAGQTLARWLAAQPRTSAAIIEVFMQAARGLHAAHEIGLVHCDFKPSNVLVGDDGRVRLVDFGLSSSTLDRTSDGDASTRDEWRPRIRGTPAYMSLEQLTGGAVTPKSDQFSFCVALYEALYGARPFSGDDLDALRDALLHHRVRPPSRAGIPRRLAKIVLRGLERRPDSRWSDMQEVIDACGRRERRKSWVLLGSIGATVGVSFAAAHGLAASAKACEPERFPDTSAIHAAFESAAPGFGGASWAHMRAGLERYARQWNETWARVCRSEMTEARDRRLACLSERRAEWEGLVEAVQVPSRAAVVKAPRLVDELPSIERCLEATEGSSSVRAAMRDKLAHLRMYARMAPPADADARLHELLASARSEGATAVEAEILRLLGGVQSSRLDDASAQHFFETAFHLARAHGHDGIASDAGLSLVLLLSNDPRREAETSRWGRHVLALLDAPPEGEAPYEQERRKAELYHALAQAALFTGELDRAQRYAQAGLEVFPDEGPPWLHAHLLRLFAESLRQLGRPEQAKAQLHEAMGILAAESDENAVDLAFLIEALAIVDAELGEHDAARELFQRGIELNRRVWGPDHLYTINSRYNAAMTSARNGDYASALAELEPIYAAYRALGEETAWMLVPTALSIARSHYDLGHFEQAEAWAERVLELHAAADGQGEANDARRLLARCLGHKGDVVAAVQRWGELLVALEGREAMADAHGELAELLRRSGSMLRARISIEQSLALLDGSDDADALATWHFVHSKILRSLGHHQMAREALAHALEHHRGLPTALSERPHPHSTEAVRANIRADLDRYAREFGSH